MQSLKLGSKGEYVRVLQKALRLYPDGIFGPLTQEAVIEYQKSMGIRADGIVGSQTWNTLTREINTFNDSRAIDEIIVHCTATPQGQDYTVEQIRNLHMRTNGWADIGYHYVIYRDGSLNIGRAENVIGAHCTGHNAHSIGVCYVGGLDVKGNPKDTRTDAQKETLLRLLKDLKRKYPSTIIHSHRDFANKECPCFDATKEYKDI